MTYRYVTRNDLEEQDGPFEREDLLNSMETDGWTLTHVIQGYVSQDEELGLIHVEPSYIFHKPDGPQPNG